MQRMKSSPNRPHDRRGAAAAEFAIMVPLFLTLILGAVQGGLALDASHKMYSVIRQAGRLAGQNYSERLQPDETINEKIIQDIRNQLTSVGIDGDAATISITHADGSSAGAPFDLSDSSNSYGLFKITITAPISSLGASEFMPTGMTNMSASLVFRKGKNTLVN